ncbi:hypothetical protein [Microbacterium sp. KR10-403]|uniref:hypothetical protein n=1 Tax=Microbacterium sp. KR10-403 TaxID=3158581 RepID=UPI0032E37277
MTLTVTHEVTFTQNGTTYYLRKGVVHLGGGKYSRKVVYELTGSTSLHGATREDISVVLQKKFELTRHGAERILDALDNAGMTEEAPRRRVDPGAPKIAGGGLPTRRPGTN